MVKSGGKTTWKVSGWLIAMLGSACASTNETWELPLLETYGGGTAHIRTGTRTSATTGTGPVSLQGRLVSRSTGLRIGLGGPAFVVDLSGSQHAHEPGKPPCLTRNKEGFSPTLCVVPMGARIRFDNKDKIFHNFFSSSVGNEFDLAPLDPGNSAFIRFQNPGLVQVYCSLHSGHRATVLVLPGSTFARVDAEGEFHLRDLNPGLQALELWSVGLPRQKMEVFVTGKENHPIDFPVDPVPAKAGR